jgi:hypothetical protein
MDHHPPSPSAILTAVVMEQQKEKEAKPDREMTGFKAFMGGGAGGVAYVLANVSFFLACTYSEYHPLQPTCLPC